MTGTRIPDDTATAVARPPARPIVGPVALAIAPLALLAGNLIGVGGASHDPDRITALAENSAGEQVAILLFLLATTLLLAGTAAMLPFLHGRGATLGRIGATLAFPGLVAFAGLTTTWLYDIGLAASVSPAEAAEISTATGATGAAAVVLGVGLLGMPLGLVALTAALWRAGITPVWSPVLVFVAFVVVSVVDNQAGGIAGNLLLFAGLARVGRDLARSA